MPVTFDQEWDSSTYITVKCRKCGVEYGFFPLRVVALRECKCGNANWGSYRDWRRGDFGDFDYVKTESLVYRLHYQTEYVEGEAEYQ